MKRSQAQISGGEEAAGLLESMGIKIDVTGHSSQLRSPIDESPMPRVPASSRRMRHSLSGAPFPRPCVENWFDYLGRSYARIRMHSVDS
jgi:hypothetical protein